MRGGGGHLGHLGVVVRFLAGGRLHLGPGHFAGLAQRGLAPRNVLGRQFLQLGSRLGMHGLAHHRLAHGRQVVFGHQRPHAARLVDLPAVVRHQQQQQDDTRDDQSVLQFHLKRPPP
ncbi:hypothetical protein D3C85_1482550 [compost metagenome]